MRQFVYQGAQPRVLEQDAYHFVEKLDSGQFEGGGHMRRERKRERLREKREYLRALRGSAGRVE